MRFGDLVDDRGTEIDVGGQSGGPPIEVTGTRAPGPLASWWPWLIAAGVVGALWWLTREPARPKGGAG